MAPFSRPSLRRAGFTLVEVMLATVIYGMFMIVVMNSMQLTRNLSRYQEDTGRTFLEAYTARVWVETDFRNFVPPPRATGEETPLEVNRSGDETTPLEKVAFWSVVQRPFERQGVYKVEYEAEGGNLVRRVRWGKDAGGDSVESVQRFFTKVKGLKVRFKTEPDAEPVRAWPYKYLPRYVYLQVVFGGKGAADCEWTLNLGQVS